MRRTVLICDDHALFASTLLALLSADKGLGEIELASDLSQALEIIELKRCDLAITFASYPLQALATKIDKMREKECKVLLIINASDRFAAANLPRFHADGLISTRSSFKEFQLALDTIVNDRRKYISPHLISDTSNAFPKSSPFSDLSCKELDVALAIMGGKRIGEIANELNISHKTVSTYKTRIFKKLEISSDVQLLIYASKNGGVSQG